MNMPKNPTLLNAAYIAMQESRAAWEGYFKAIHRGEEPSDLDEALRLARDVERKTRAFEAASRPFIYTR